MPIHVVRLGTPRDPTEGPRLGTVRRPPRGVAKADHARLDYYDLWVPLLAPSAALVAEARAAVDARAWARFARRYRAEMKAAAPSQLLDLLALLSRQGNFSVGCYCEDASRCHRSLLRELLRERGADVAALS